MENFFFILFVDKLDIGFNLIAWVKLFVFCKLMVDGWYVKCQCFMPFLVICHILGLMKLLYFTLLSLKAMTAIGTTSKTIWCIRVTLQYLKNFEKPQNKVSPQNQTFNQKILSTQVHTQPSTNHKFKWTCHLKVQGQPFSSCFQSFSSINIKKYFLCNNIKMKRKN